MSCYGQERGEIKLPSTEFQEFKKRLYNRYNDRLLEIYNHALKIHEKLLLVKPKNRYNAFIEYELYDIKGYFYNNLIERELFRGKDKGLTKPRKSKFKVSAQKNDLLIDDDLDIRFSPKTNYVEYLSDDNNHSIDRARESWLGKQFFNLLRSVKFTSKTGGYFIAKTEYDEFNGPTISQTYGKYTKPKYYKTIMRY